MAGLAAASGTESRERFRASRYDPAMQRKRSRIEPMLANDD
jgi:hypothetical protein